MSDAREEGQVNIDEMEKIAKAAQEGNPGPWRKFNYDKPADRSFDFIVDSSPRPDWMDDPDEEWIGERVITTDSNCYGPHGATAEHIAAFSPDVVLGLIARIRELEGVLCPSCERELRK